MTASPYNAADEAERQRLFGPGDPDDDPQETPRRVSVREPFDRSRRWIVGAVVVLLLAALFVRDRDRREANARLAEVAADRTELAQDVAVLSEQVESLGGTPAVAPPADAPSAPDPVVIPGQPGEDGEDGAPGPPGKDGADGPIGATGAAGEDGDPGSDGAPGEDGTDGAPGADGATGQPGVDGQDGRGIVDQRCTEDGQLVTEFTDGTTDVVDGATACEQGGPPISVPPP